MKRFERWWIEGTSPRARGKRWVAYAVPWMTWGTSPRARGKLANDSEEAQADRNIPACAGKTGFNEAFDVFDQEHPRVRGENQ